MSQAFYDRDEGVSSVFVTIPDSMFPVHTMSFLRERSVEAGSSRSTLNN